MYDMSVLATEVYIHVFLLSTGSQFIRGSLGKAIAENGSCAGIDNAVGRAISLQR